MKNKLVLGFIAAIMIELNFGFFINAGMTYRSFNQMGFPGTAINLISAGIRVPILGEGSFKEAGTMAKSIWIHLTSEQYVTSMGLPGNKVKALQTEQDLVLLPSLEKYRTLIFKVLKSPKKYGVPLEVYGGIEFLSGTAALSKSWMLIVDGKSATVSGVSLFTVLLGLRHYFNGFDKSEDKFFWGIYLQVDSMEDSSQSGFSGINLGIDLGYGFPVLDNVSLEFLARAGYFSLTGITVKGNSGSTDQSDVDEFQLGFGSQLTFDI